MTRRTVEIGFASVDGLRTDGKHDIALLTINGDAVEVHVSPSMLGIVKDLYGHRARLQLVVDDFQPNGGNWKDTNGAYFRVEETIGPRAKPEERAAPTARNGRTMSEVQSDAELLQRALERCGGVKSEVAARAGLGKSAYHMASRRLRDGLAFTDKMRAALTELVERGGDDA